MNEELVSVVIPAFDAEQYIVECINSVLNQSYQNLEIVIVDDGSRDNTVNIINKYQSDKIKLFHQNNSGSAAARNHGIKQASGTWIAFIDSDDIWLPDKLQKQLENCSDHVWSHTDLYLQGDIYPEHTKTTEITPKYSGFILEKLLVENSIGTSSVLIKKEILEEFEGFNTDLHALQDWDLWLKVAAKYDVCYLDEPMVRYRIHSSSVSRNARKTYPYHMALIKRVFSDDGIGANFQHLKKETLAQSSQICSQISEQEEDFTLSCYCAAKSVFYRPLNFSIYIRLLKITTKTVIYLVRNIYKPTYRENS